jgi:predicted small metal-binding protein
MALWEADMAKMFECGTVVPGCKFVVHGDTEADVMSNATEHLRSSHEIEHFSERLKAKMRAAIKTVIEPAA